MLDRGQKYDLAVSFAGAQRSLAKRFAHECESLGLVVFFDENVAGEMWGRDIIKEFRLVYGGELARYVVPFLSAEYFEGPYPMDEFDAANTYAIQRGDDPYLLPITVGDVKIPEKLMRSSILYLRSEDHSVEELARMAADRVSGRDGFTPAPIGTVRSPVKGVSSTEAPPGTQRSNLTHIHLLDGRHVIGSLRGPEPAVSKWTTDGSYGLRWELSSRSVLEYSFVIRLDAGTGAAKSSVWVSKTGGRVNFSVLAQGSAIRCELTSFTTDPDYPYEYRAELSFIPLDSSTASEEEFVLTAAPEASGECSLFLGMFYPSAY